MIISPEESPRQSDFFQDKVILTSKGKKEQTTVSISTTKQQMAAYFEEYGNLLGFNGTEARKEFENRVDFTFNREEALVRFKKSGSFIENAFAQIYHKAGALNFAAFTFKEKDGRIVLSLDLNDIAKKSKTSGPDSLESFHAFLNTVTNHEMRHVLQFIAEPDLVAKKRAQDFAQQKLTAVAVPAFAAGIAIPEMIPHTLGGIAAMKCFLFIVQGRNINMEKDPEIAQKTDMSNLQRRPFNLAVISTPELAQ